MVDKSINLFDKVREGSRGLKNHRVQPVVLLFWPVPVNPIWPPSQDEFGVWVTKKLAAPALINLGT